MVVLLQALYLGAQIEATTAAAADSAKGQAIAVPAAIALVAGVVAAAGHRRRWALAVGCGAATAAVLAVLLAVLFPRGEY